MTKFKLILILLLINSAAFAHKFYVSIADMKYNVEKNRIEGTLKVTAHDFEKVLINKFGGEIEMEQVVDSSNVGRYMQHYLATNFKIYSQNVAANPVYIGKEVTLRNELYFYFTFENIANPKAIKIVNTILFEHFPGQQNIIHYRYGDQTKSVTLVPSKPHEKIIFD